jgi:putative PIN family toxin of toxin-antitoxin system
MRIVLDTNVLIAAFITRGSCHELVEHCVQNHSIVISDFILREVSDHLIHKFGYSQSEAQEVLALLKLHTRTVSIGPLETRVCRDADDDNVLATALAGDADCIVTGDTDLLSLGRFRGVRIVRPAGFADYEAQPGS